MCVLHRGLKGTPEAESDANHKSVSGAFCMTRTGPIRIWPVFVVQSSVTSRSNAALCEKNSQDACPYPGESGHA